MMFAGAPAGGGAPMYAAPQGVPQQGWPQGGPQGFQGGPQGFQGGPQGGQPAGFFDGGRRQTSKGPVAPDGSSGQTMDRGLNFDAMAMAGGGGFGGAPQSQSRDLFAPV